MQDAAIDLDHDLRTRLRDAGPDGRGRVDADDPADDLVFEAWVHKTGDRGGRRPLRARSSSAPTRWPTRSASTSPRSTGRPPFQVEAAVPADLLAAVHVNREQRLMKDGVARRLVTTGQGYSSGLILFSSVVGVVSALPWIPLLALPFAGLMAKRAFSDDRDRRAAPTARSSSASPPATSTRSGSSSTRTPATPSGGSTATSASTTPPAPNSSSRRCSRRWRRPSRPRGARRPADTDRPGRRPRRRPDDQSSPVGRSSGSSHGAPVAS